MKSRFQIVMLPTDEASYPCVMSIEKEGKPTLLTVLTEPYTDNAFSHQLNDLYLIDTQAVVGVEDWVTHKSMSVVGKLVYNQTFEERNIQVFDEDGFGLHNHCLKSEVFKIVASTNLSLGLPTFHPETIQRYCENPQLEIVDVVYNVGKVDEDGKWGNFTNADFYEEALSLAQGEFPFVRVMLFWKEYNLADNTIVKEIWFLCGQTKFDKENYKDAWGIINSFNSEKTAQTELEKYQRSNNWTDLSIQCISSAK
jgi:hypothetical protein